MLNLLMEFANGLNKLSDKYIDEIEIILPYDSYKILEDETYKYMMSEPLIYKHPNTKLSIVTMCGIRFQVTCKEINDVLLQKKLKECFKTLSEQICGRFKV